MADEHQPAVPARGPLATRPLIRATGIAAIPARRSRGFAGARLAALLLLAGCARCGPKSAASAEELLPGSAPGAVVTAPLGILAQNLAALADRASQLPGGEQLVALRKGVAAQLGFDPLTREGLLSAGLDPDRGAAIALLSPDPRPPFLIALPLTNPAQFSQAAQKLLVERAGFAPLRPQLFERKGAQLGLAVVRGYGVLTRGADAEPALREAETRKQNVSLAGDPGFLEVRKKLGAPDLLLYAPQGSEWPKRFGAPALPGSMALSIAASAQGLALRAVAQLPFNVAQRAQAVLPGGGASLVSLLPADAPLRVRLGIAPFELIDLLKRIPRLDELSSQLDPAALAACLQPGAAISLGVEKTASLAKLVDSGLDWRRETPFHTAQLVALAEAREPEKCLLALEGLAAKLPDIHAQAVRAKDASEWSVTYPGGEGVRFGMRDVGGRKIVYALGGAILAAQLAQAAADKDPEAAALLQDPGAALRLDLGKLYDAVHALPESAYGSGPSAYVTRSLATQVIDPLRTVRVNAALQAQPDGLSASLDLELVAP